MKLETERLFVYPVENGTMRELINNETDAQLKQAYSEMLEGCLKDPENRIWSAVWFIEPKGSPGVIAGDLSFKGPPDDGAVEIGYGLREGFCKKGYMTEAVKAVCGWAFSQNGVLRVEAETDPDNLASQKVLASCGFAPAGTYGEEGPRFTLERTSP
ncbi:MAG: GNAT family N-acetyltransferase [Clostridia bacterium]|nr:GNAT family N-acetyltransferase [Clostridia bacterium]